MNCGRHRIGRRLSILAPGLLALSVLWAAAAQGAGEAVDPAFDGDGRQTTSFATTVPPLPDVAHDVAVEADGQIVLAGVADLDDDSLMGRFGVVRYNTVGSLDTVGFGGGTGKVTTDFADYPSASAESVAIQPDGKIVAAGGAFVGGQYVYAVARYGIGGAPDLEFSGDGQVHTDVVVRTDQGSSSGDVARDVVIAPDNGDIVTVGNGDGVVDSFAQPDIGIAVYEADGDPDNSFSGDGVLNQDMFPSVDSWEQAETVEVQPDGKIVVAGSVFFPDTDATAGFVARFEPDGDPDVTFSADGIQELDFGSEYVQILDVDLLADGRILAAGSASGDSAPVIGSDFAIARIGSNGTLDASFDGDGKKTIDLADDPTDSENLYDSAGGVEGLADGKIVVGGVTSGDWGAIRLTSSGALDSARVSVKFTAGTSGGGEAMAVQADGKVLLAAGPQSEDVGTPSPAFGVLRFSSLGVPPDETEPTTTITGVTVTRSRHKAKVRFTGADESGPLTFECKLDGLSYTPCSSPKIYRGLSERRHEVRVRARDAAGNVDLTPAKHSFRI